MKDETHRRMAGDYEIIQAIHIGDREIVLGEKIQDESVEKYMCAFCQQNELFAAYSEVMCSDNYAEIVKMFGERVTEQAEKNTPLINRTAATVFPMCRKTAILVFPITLFCTATT